MTRANRLFIALPIPKTTALSIAQWQQRVAPPRVKIILPEQLHLTLAFLGPQDEARQQEIEQALAHVHGTSWQQGLQITGSFHRAQIGYLAPAHPAPELLALASQIQHDVSQIGVAISEHTYRPHVTVFRKLKRCASWSPKVPGWSWQASAFCLYQSINGHYRELNRWPLRP